jgi:hypothetical protein
MTIFSLWVVAADVALIRSRGYIVSEELPGFAVELCQAERAGEIGPFRVNVLPLKGRSVCR